MVAGTKTAVVTAALAVGLAACGSSSHKVASGPTNPASQAALSAEANSAATGDVPDNQVFLTFTNAKAGYSIKYPEGWTQHGAGRDLTFQDKNNQVHIVIAAGGAPTVASVKAGLSELKGTNKTLQAGTPQAVRIKGAPAVKVNYTTQSAPNAVTGKRVTLTVDRYELAKGGKLAIVDLGTPKGVDNVDAYRMMIESFRWR